MHAVQTRPLFIISTIILSILSLTGCAQRYDAQSRKDVVDETCETFDDGCNVCNRQADGTAICTQDTCDAYTRPTCLDETLTDAQKHTLSTGVLPTPETQTDTHDTTIQQDDTTVDISRPSGLHPTRDIDNDGLNDCETNDTCDDTADYNKPNPDVVASLKKRYVGTSVSEAQEIAAIHGDNFQVTIIDGTTNKKITEIVPGRINAIVENNVITTIVIE